MPRTVVPTPDSDPVVTNGRSPVARNSRTSIHGAPA